MTTAALPFRSYTKPPCLALLLKAPQQFLSSIACATSARKE